MELTPAEKLALRMASLLLREPPGATVRTAESATKSAGRPRTGARVRPNSWEET